jgi:hypothetical protein
MLTDEDSQSIRRESHSARNTAMPSPFPGMNPYFEQAAHWLDFHTEYLSAIRRLLAPQVAPKYIVQLEEHIYIHDLPFESRQRLGNADLSLVQPGQHARAGGGPAVLEAPSEVWLPEQEVEEVPFLEVRDRLGRELVTVIELLSPSNKRPSEDREQYLAKRRELLRSTAHLVEIDLLRGWTPMPQEGRPDCDYSVMVSRAEKRRAAGFWPIRLRERLPLIPIPLRPPDDAAPVDLQEALHRAYDGPGYEHFIYRGTPDPPLSAEDAEWARQYVSSGNFQ